MGPLRVVGLASLTEKVCSVSHAPWGSHSFTKAKPCSDRFGPTVK